MLPRKGPSQTREKFPARKSFAQEMSGPLAKDRIH
jgi:hypothetical protein